MPLTIYRRGEIYHYRGTVAGDLLRGSTRTSDKATAQRIAAEIEARHWKGHLDGPASVLTFAQAVELYRRAGKSPRFVVRVLDHWKDTPVKHITASAIRDSCSRLYPNAGPATWNRHVIVPTQAIINHASEQELCPPIRVRRFKSARKEREATTWTWVQAFMSASTTPHLAAIACFMFLTAARVGEACSLTWDQVDLKTHRALIRQTKVGSERRAHLPPPLIVALANIEGDRTGRVFKYTHPHNLKTQWEGAIRRAGIKRLTPHCCRHGFATSLLQAGVDVRTVAELGGWKTPALVLSTYSHAMRDPRLTDRLVINTQKTHGDVQTTNRIAKANG